MTFVYRLLVINSGSSIVSRIKWTRSKNGRIGNIQAERIDEIVIS
jgi:hypothetical protein